MFIEDNFSSEPLDIKLRNTTIKEDEETFNPYLAPRNVDILTHLYLTFELPNIYSGSRNADGDENSTVNNMPYEFKWVENIGTNLIKEAKLYIDTNEVNSLSGNL